MSRPSIASVVLEPEVQRFLAENGKPPYLHQMEPAEGRRVVDEVQRTGVPRPDADIRDITVPDAPTRRVPVRLVLPPGAPDLLPVIVYLHGSGWVFGGPHTHDRLIRELATRTGAAVVFPVYSRSPEAGYPAALEEAYLVTQWVADRGAEYGLDGSRVAVAGDSVGGNLATALTLLAKERSGPGIVHQVLFYPVTDATFDTDSYLRFAEGYFVRRDQMMWYWDQYTMDPDERAQITASPLRATPAQLDGLPPALIITSEADPLRDEGEAYARNLRAAGVPVTAVRYTGTIHDFVMLDALADTQAARAATAQAAGTLRRALHGA
jgi:acetyl esterase